MLAAAVLAALLASGGTVLLLDRATTDPTAVLAEPAHSPGAQPFLAAGTDPDLDLAPPPGTGGAFTGDTPGLFGAARGVAPCEPTRMAELLRDDRAKAGAWSGQQDLAVTELRAYIGRLTPVVLRSDTAVTSSRFQDGRAQEAQVVLQAGTAVLVDEFGVPRAKCGSGNPLTPPRHLVRPTYPNTAWPGFSPATITTIEPAPAPIEEFTLVDPPSGAAFQRPAGSTGARDR